MQGVLHQKSLASPLLLQKRPHVESRWSLRRTVSTPGLRALLAVIAVFVLYLRYGFTHWYRDPGSVFYDTDSAYERGYSLVRQAQGEEYLKTALGLTTRNTSRITLPFTKAGRKPSVCAGIIATRRHDGIPYIETSIATLLDRMTTYEREDLHLKVLFATANASQHPTWNKPWLRSLVDEVFTYNGVVAEDDFKLLAALEKETNSKVKGVTDYTIALKHCYESTSAPFIAVFEEDVLFAETVFARTVKAVRHIQHEMEGDEKGWLSMRLFNQESSTSWPSRRVGSNNEHWLSLVIGSIVLVALLAYRRKSYAVRRHLDNWTLAVLCLIAVPGFVVLFFQSGKASLLPPHPGVRREDVGIGGQGMVFNREQVPGLIRYLKQRELGQYDFITRDYAKHQKLARFSLYPVQMQHIGGQPVVADGKRDAHPAWSMAFEALDPTKLEGQHMNLVSELYRDKIKAAVAAKRGSLAVLGR